MKTETDKVLQLPILRHFEQSDVLLRPQKGRKGEKGIGVGVGILLLGTTIWGLYGYVLPVVFSWVGHLLGALTAAGLAVAFCVLLPVLAKAVKRLARALHRLLIRRDPFGELAAQGAKMVQHRSLFREARVKIKALRSGMEGAAANAEKEVKSYREKVLVLQSRAEATRRQMADLERRLGEATRDSDTYTDLQADLLQTVGEGQRVGHLLEQGTDLIRKYGSRAHVIGKLDRKLNRVDTVMGIKIADFQASIQMLKKEYAFARAAEQATRHAKSALGFTQGWELEYALDVVTQTVAQDLAATRANLFDLDALTSQYPADNDELYARLDRLADGIKTDAREVPPSAPCRNPNASIGAEDRAAAGGFGNIFN